MSDPFVAEIKIFAGNFPPKGYATCDGQLLPISQNTALFSLLGTTYGGDGKSTFALPNMAGNAPMQQGQGQGLSLRDLGETSGTPTVTLLSLEMPSHNHIMQGSTEDGTLKAPSPNLFLGHAKGGTMYQSNTTQNLTQMNFQELALAGQSLPHNNLPPYLTLTFIIALQGIFPARP